MIKRILLILVFLQIFGNLTFATDNTKTIVMSYKIGGAFSPYIFAYVTIYQDREVICHFNYLQKEYKTNLSLSENQFQELISLYKKAEFFNLKLPSGQENWIDTGTSKLFLKIDDKERELVYRHLENQAIVELVKRYWDIIVGEKCLIDLNNYSELTNSYWIEDLNELAMIDVKNINHIKELENAVVKISTDNKVPLTTRQLALEALANFGTNNSTSQLLTLLKDENFKESGPFAQDVMEAIYSTVDYRAIEPLIGMLEDKTIHPYCRDKAAKTIERITDHQLLYDVFSSDEVQRPQIEKIKTWWLKNKAKFYQSE